MAREERAWDEFIQTYGAAIRAGAARALRAMQRRCTEPDVEEIKSGVLEMLLADDFRVLRTFRGQCSIETWLSILARTACHREFRRRSFRPISEQDPAFYEQPLDRMLSDETQSTIALALGELPAREREVLMLFFIEGRPYREISDQMGLPMGTIASILARTRLKLREILVKRGMNVRT